MFFIIKELKETILDFSQGAVKVLCEREFVPQFDFALI